ncbi:MAG: glycosyltransferase family 2 protein [Anaerolineaceae bacterium]|nr:glycosyltransferase family 2 protein [Anaerolineaceae bacterium]
MVSVIIPCFNEEATIEKTLQALFDQSFPTAEIEIIIADGHSTDKTRQRIEQFAHSHATMKVIVLDNDKKNIPAGLNVALNAAIGEFIIRMDAHSEPNTVYIEKTVELLKAGKADNIGGVWKIQPSSDHWISKSIAAAASHPFGVGDAFYRFAKTGRYVDTVPFGGFKRELLSKIGFFDEGLLSNEDYEFNTRIRQNGGQIWLDPEIQSNYYARETLKQLAVQYWRYGYWKFQMLRRYPDTIKLRQAMPPLFVLSILFLLICSIFWMPAKILLGIEIILYFLVLLVGSFKEARQRKQSYLLGGMPLAIMVMHIVWGSAFLYSTLTMFRGRKSTTNG